MREAFEAWQASMSDTAKTPPAEMAQKQIEHGQKAIEKALSNMRELAEMAIKSQTDAADVIRKRFEAGLKEIQNR
jgi:phasin family protein